MAKKRILIYDIETSFCKGHFWRPGWNQTIHPNQITEHAKIISIHWKWLGKDKVHNLDWGLKNQCDKKMLKKFIEQMDKADLIITHNGKRFDTPWIRTRAIFHNLDIRPTYNEVDTYKLAKKYLNLPSYSLKNVCDYYSLESKKDAGGIQTWIDVVYNKSRKALDHLLYYGDGDITSLEDLYLRLKKYIPNKTHFAVLNGGEKYSCPDCLSNNVGISKTYTTAAGTIQHYMKCRECSQHYKVNNKTYMDLLQFKIKNNIK
jgi:DNA polymerase elongation subunit (family B)